MRFLVYLVVAVITVFGVMLEMDVFVEPAHKPGIARHVAIPVAPVVPLAAPTTDARAVEPAPPTLPQQRAAKAASDKCDVTACAAAYRSFRAADCTFEAGEGRRELCTKGVVSDRAAAEAVLNAHADAATGRTSALCNVSACTAAYHSFTPADCTYQPTEGPRRLCTK